MKLKHLLFCLLTVMCCGGMLMANTPKGEDGERIPVATNEQVEIEAIAQLEERISKAQELQKQGGEESLAIAAKTAPSQESTLASATAKALFSNQASTFTNTLSTAHGVSFINYPGTYHPLVRFLGSEIRLEDGSWWKVYSGDLSETSNWLTENDLSIVDIALGLRPDTVVVTANGDWPTYSSYRYHLTNQQTGKYVRVNLSDFYSGVNTRYIYSHVWLYDAYGSLFVQLTLNDGSVWNTLPVDTQCLDWHNGDIVVVGVNTDQYSTFAPNLLINVRTNNNGAAACVLYYN